MKGFCLAITAALLLAGCGENTSTPAASSTNAASGNPLDAPADYLRAVGKAQQNTVKTVDTSSINKAIELFNVDKGRNPRDLNELVEQKFLPQIPPVPAGHKLNYDATAGKVTVVKQ